MVRRSDTFSILRFPVPVPEPSSGSAVTLGSFDGLHLGHQALLRAVTGASNYGHRIVLSFYPHPSIVLKRASKRAPLLTLRQRARIADQLGVDLHYLVRFSPQFSSWSAEDFLEKVLIEKLNTRLLVVGPDAALGRNREGNLERIAEYLQKRGCEVRVIPWATHDGERISTKHIRELIQRGDVELAGRLLGRPFALDTRATRGEGRGSRIGIPTINSANIRQIVPERGVYVSTVLLRGVAEPAVTNIGVRPTFEGAGETVESHLLRFSGSVSPGEHVEVQLLARLREERRFPSSEALVSQIQFDIEAAHAFHLKQQ